MTDFFSNPALEKKFQSCEIVLGLTRPILRFSLGGMRVSWKRRGLLRIAMFGSSVLLLISPRVVQGDDLVTLSGTVYHDVQPLRVEPDGVTWQYDEGMAKVDFADCPESVRQRFHYDAAKAAAYHSAQVQARAETEARVRQTLQENDARRLARAQAAAATAPTRSAADTDIIFRHALSPAASDATRALGEQAAAAAAKKANAPTQVWDALAHSTAGKILAVMGVNFGPGGPPPDKDEYKASLHNQGGTVPASDAAHSSFYTPDYSTRTYYEDADRSAAFLRGVPLKP